METIKISEFVSYNEATHSNTAVAKNLSNKPTEAIITTMQNTAKHVFDPVRKALGPLRVNCFYRAPEVNKAVGGAPTSQHTKGEAIDISGTGSIKNSEIFKFIKENLVFDQLIAENITNGEPSWIHVSYTSGNNRNQILVAIPKVPGKPGWRYEPYKKGLVNNA